MKIYSKSFELSHHQNNHNLIKNFKFSNQAFEVSCIIKKFDGILFKGNNFSLFQYLNSDLF